MKRPWLVMICVTVFFIGIVAGVNLLLMKKIDLSNTQRLIINFEFWERPRVHTEVTDPKDFENLIRICSGTANNGLGCSVPSCGFGSVELIFETEYETIKIYPACDTCDTMRLGEENKFFYGIEDDKRVELEGILKKYGIEFPCV